MTAGGASLRLGPLTAEHRDELAAFPCARYDAPWTDDVEYMVQEMLAGALETGEVHALGLWRDDLLVGVVAWTWPTNDPTVARCGLLAVRTGHVRRGYGTWLKRALLDRARAVGATEVVSRVHFDNDAMFELNRGLGASIERDEGDHDYLICVIPL